MLEILFEKTKLFERTYSLEEYAQILRGKEEDELLRLERADIDKIDLIERIILGELETKEIEAIATKIIRDDKLRRMFVFVAGSLLFFRDNAVLASTSSGALKTQEALNKIDVAGFTILSVIRKIGYFIMIFMCIIEVLRCVSNGDTKEIGKIILKYVLAFMALYLLPWLMDIVIGIFG